jgi:hypothetical protein
LPLPHSIVAVSLVSATRSGCLIESSGPVNGRTIVAEYTDIALAFWLKKDKHRA